MPVAAELATHVLHSHSASEQRKRAGTDDTNLPITRDALQQVAERLSRGISDVKYQIEAHVSANFETFKAQADKATKVITEAKKLSLAITELHGRVEDPNHGLSRQLREALKEHDDVKREMEVVDISLDVVQKMAEIDSLFATYAKHLSSNDYPGALATIMRMDALIRSLPSWDDVTIFNELINKYSSAEMDLRNRLEYIISETLCVEMGKGLVTLRVADSVSAQGLGPEPISLQTALSAIVEHKLESVYLTPFTRMVYKRIVDPVIRDPRWTVVVAENNLRTVFTEGPFSPWSALPQGALFDRLDTILEFLISALGSDESGVPYAHSVFSLFGTTFSTDTSNAIISCYLEKMIPSEAKEMDTFVAIAERCRVFEDRAATIGLVPEGQKSLTAFCQDLELHFTNKRHLTLLQTSRAFVTTKEYATVELPEATLVPMSTFVDVAPSSGGGPTVCEELQRGLFTFPKCVISVATRNLIHLVKETLKDAQELSPFCKVRLQHSVRAVLDLFRAIVPVHAANRLATIPQMPMVFYNDCMYIAHELLILNWHTIASRPAETVDRKNDAGYLGLTVAYREIGDNILQAELSRQRKNLKDIVDSADGFDVLDDRRKDIVERVLKQLSHQVVLLSHVWQPVLPSSVYRVTMTPLINYTLRLIMSEIFSLVDIGESESHTLNTMLTSFKERVQPLLDDSTMTTTPRFTQFEHLVRILDASFAEIMELFRSGDLKMFTGPELVGLVRALFADTPLRRANLEEIEENARRLLAQ
ncbi:Centromere/kinetochore Zw10-domain-containing protein [Powellomyces hirtus]|nr:Centromere/kinetochore Zw10-domain-containing protein [Powellomyces hirtus]